ncbi:MAG: hypothetical protein JWO42_3496, partial [Chloroflexi bacterium]|nr:hypothetical protein [Chloroflexota bacterium]
PITVASRLGTLQLRRQMLSHWDSGVRVRPGDQALPIRRGMVISRSLRERAFLLTQDVSFATAARLLGWQAQEERILSPTTLCTLVRRHGALVRIAEREAIGAYPYQAGGSLAPVPLVPYSTPKRRAGWPAVLSNAVEAALARENTCPPRSIAWADWARVIEARRSDPARSATDLRHLVPDVAEHQLLVTIDEVLACADSAGVYRAAHRAYSHMGRLSLLERSGRRLPAAGARMDRALP